MTVIGAVLRGRNGRTTLISNTSFDYLTKVFDKEDAIVRSQNTMRLETPENNMWSCNWHVVKCTIKH
jgi:hypothetical protein